MRKKVLAFVLTLALMLSLLAVPSSADESVHFTAAQLILGQEIALVYYTDTPYSSGLTMRTSLLGRNETVDAFNSGGNAAFRFDGIGPQEIGETISATVYNGGSQVSDVREYSVKSACQDLLTMDYSSYTAAERNSILGIVSDLVQYAEAARLYKEPGYESASEGVSNLATYSPRSLDSVTAGSKTSVGGTADFAVTGAAVYFYSYNSYYFVFKTTYDIGDIEFKVTTNRTTNTYNQFKQAGDKYYFYTDMMYPTELAEPATVKGYYNGTEMFSFAYSAQSYYNDLVASGASDTMKGLAKTLCLFGQSADAYKNMFGSSDPMAPQLATPVIHLTPDYHLVWDNVENATGYDVYINGNLFASVDAATLSTAGMTTLAGTTWTLPSSITRLTGWGPAEDLNVNFKYKSSGSTATHKRMRWMQVITIKPGDPSTWEYLRKGMKLLFVENDDTELSAFYSINTSPGAQDSVAYPMTISRDEYDGSTIEIIDGIEAEDAGWIEFFSTQATLTARKNAVDLLEYTSPNGVYNVEVRAKANGYRTSPSSDSCNFVQAHNLSVDIPSTACFDDVTVHYKDGTDATLAAGSAHSASLTNVVYFTCGSRIMFNGEMVDPGTYVLTKNSSIGAIITEHLVYVNTEDGSSDENQESFQITLANGTTVSDSDGMFDATSITTSSYVAIVEDGINKNIENETYVLTSDIEVYRVIQRECIDENTLVTMADGSLKKLGEIELGDMVLSVDFETMTLIPRKVIFTGKDAEDNDQWYVDCYWENVYSDGTVIKQAMRHRFYDLENCAFTYLHEWNIGEHAYSIDGENPTLVSRTLIQGTIRYARITLEDCNCYFANGLLTGDRHCPSGYVLDGPLGNDRRTQIDE